MIVGSLYTHCEPAAVIAATNCLISYPSATHFSLFCVGLSAPRQSACTFFFSAVHGHLPPLSPSLSLLSNSFLLALSATSLGVGDKNMCALFLWHHRWWQCWWVLLLLSSELHSEKKWKRAKKKGIRVKERQSQRVDSTCISMAAKTFADYVPSSTAKKATRTSRAVLLSLFFFLDVVRRHCIA